AALFSNEYNECRGAHGQPVGGSLIGGTESSPGSRPGRPVPRFAQGRVDAGHAHAQRRIGDEARAGWQGEVEGQAYIVSPSKSWLPGTEAARQEDAVPDDLRGWGDDWMVGLRVWIERAGQSMLGPGRAELLERIEQHRSISAAAREIGM